MQQITETKIDSISAQLSAKPEQFESLIQDFSVKQPHILSFILSESTQMLSQEEREYMLYLGVIIWTVIKEETEDLPLLEAPALEACDEQNWELMNSNKASTFRDRLTPVFEGYPQEDILAFIEDALVDDEEDFLSKEGREMIFVILKSIVDCFDKTVN